MQSIQKYCNTVIYADEHGKADGEVVFVYLDCDKHTLLPMDQQPAQYQSPGVSTGPQV
jgi:hypothetical protein